MLEFRLLRADEIEARIATCNQWGVSVLLYKDARCDMNILDETVGCLNWQRHHSRDNANCIVSIWDESKQQWIEKEDTGTESNTEAAKGIASDSFKRACFNLGIGRELYTSPRIFVKANQLETLEGNGNRYTCKDTFDVTNISYEDRKIVSVTLKNTKTGKLLTFTNESTKRNQTKPEEKATEVQKPIYTREWLMKYGKEPIGRDEINQILAVTEGKTGSESLDGILRSVKKNDVSELNYLQFVSIMAHFKKLAA